MTFLPRSYLEKKTKFKILQSITSIYNLFSRIFSNLLSKFIPKRYHLITTQFIKHLFVGGSGALLDLIIFSSLSLTVKSHFIILNVISFVFVFFYGFFLQKYWNYRAHDEDIKIQSVKYFIVVSVSFLLNNLFLYIFIYLFHINPIVAKILQAFLVLLWNFPAQKYWVFKKRSDITNLNVPK